MRDDPTVEAARSDASHDEAATGGLLFEVAGVTTFAFSVAFYFQSASFPWPAWKGFFAGALWLYLPILLVFGKRMSLDDIGLGFPEPARSIRRLCGSVICLLLPFCLLYAAFLPRLRPWIWTVVLPRGAGDAATALASQLILVALPEEVFFRGYLQGRLNQVWGRPWQVFGASVGPGLLAAASLFALGHLLLVPAWPRLLVALPALVFGWLRDAGEEAWTATLFHFLCNAAVALVPLVAANG